MSESCKGESKRPRVAEWTKPKSELPVGYCDQCPTKAACAEMCKAVADCLKFNCASRKSVKAGRLPMNRKTKERFIPERAKPYTWAQGRSEAVNARSRAYQARKRAAAEASRRLGEALPEGISRQGDGGLSA